MSTGQTMEFDVADEFDDGGQFLKEPGTYHLAVQDVIVGAGPQGKAIDGFTLQLEALAGTVASEAGKTINVTCFNPKLTAKDSGAFGRKKQSKLLVALNLLDPSKKGQKVSVDLSKAKGQQLVVAFELDAENSQAGKQYLQVAGLGTWHVDDPHVAGIPKQQEALKLIPTALRHDAKWFEALYAKRGAAGNSSPAGGQGGTAAGSAAPAGSVNLDDL